MKRLRYALIVGFCCFISNQSNAQQAIDSIKLRLKNVQNEEQKVREQLNLGQAYLDFGDLDNGIKTIETVYELCASKQMETLKHSTAITLTKAYLMDKRVTDARPKLNAAMAYFENVKDYENLCEALSMGIIVEMNDNPNFSTQYFKKGIQISDNHNLTKQKGELYVRMGRFKIAQDSSASSLAYSRKAIEILAPLHVKSSLASAYNNCGVALYNQSREYEVLEYYEKASNQFSIDNNFSYKMRTDVNIAHTYENLGDLDSSEKTYQHFLEICIKNNFQKGAFDMRNELATMHLYHDNNEKAYRLFKEIENQAATFLKTDDEKIPFFRDILSAAVRQNDATSADLYAKTLTDLLKKAPQKKQLAWLSSNFSEYHFYKKNHVLAYNLAQKALGLFNVDNDELITKKGIFKNLLNAANVIQKHDVAAYAFRNYLSMDSTLQAESKQKNIEYYKNKKEIERNTAQLEALNEKYIVDKNTKNTILGFGSVLLIFVGGIAYSFYKRFKDKQKSNDLLAAANEQNERLLRNILPDEVAEELKLYNKTDAKEIAAATVFFCDVKNFTQITEQLSATELVSELHFCFSAFDELLDKRDVEKIKTVGDCYIFAGGVPVFTPTHAHDVVETAIEIVAFLEQYKQLRLAEKRPFFEFRIGIHSGPLVAGVVGTKKFVYDIWGDTVNVAARMEQHGEAGKINISESTHQLVLEKYSFIPRGTINIKNKQTSVEMYFVDKK